MRAAHTDHPDRRLEAAPVHRFLALICLAAAGIEALMAASGQPAAAAAAAAVLGTLGIVFLVADRLAAAGRPAIAALISCSVILVAGPVIGYRFEGDRFCTAQRFAAYAQALGDRFVARVLPDSAANQEPPPFFDRVVACPHSVVTAHLIDEAGQPTIMARDEILAFLARRLSPP